jgi:ATP/maltotriose-dependent transcriptional regulator MalT
LICAQLGWLLREQGESRAAWEYVHEILPAGVETPPGSVQHDIGLAMQRLATRLALDAGDWAVARAWLEAYDGWLGWSGAILGRAEEQALWSAYFRGTADPTRAYQHAERSLAVATTPHQPLALIAAHRVLGVLDTDAGRYDDAAKHLDASLALADACAAPYERALTFLALAELRIAMGRPAEAKADIDAAEAICMPLDAKPALARAAALVTRLSTISDASATYPDGLSAREVEVLRLIAAGMNNHEIGDTLSISVRTVERHITNLYGKIGAHGRADATAYALRVLP